MSAAAFIDALSRRLRWRDGLWLAGAALAAGALVAAVAAPAMRPAGALAVAAVAALVVAAAGVWRRHAAWQAPAVARLAEARHPGLDNLLVTAVASERMADLSPRIREEITRQADGRVARLSPAALVPVGGALGGAVIATALAAATVMWALRPAPETGAASPAAASGGAQFEVTATVTPPPYLRMPPVTLEDPEDLRVPAGGALRLVVTTAMAVVTIEDAAGSGVALDRGSLPGTFERSWLPAQSTTSALVGRAADGTAGASRLLAVTVVADERPAVRVTRPGRDLRLPSADASIAIEVEATDDHEVSALELRYVRMSGSGESFTFGEGRVPFADVTRAGPNLSGRLSWPLGPLRLEAGEALVYRVVARDGAPGLPPGESESYTIDIGAAYETSGAGAAVAEEDRRYAISQQMVIVHTERALAERDGTPAEAWLARTQAIAAEQRSVRAEVVFLGGGEVQDEVEEAAHAHELQEGRLENRGRAEMLRAMNEMSRAEERLTAGDARGALAFERRALSALLAAFDRRRYFLRTVPERSRIDPARRLTGDRGLASPGPRLPLDRPNRLAGERALLLALAGLDVSRPVPAALAARVAALPPGSPWWSRQAAALLAAPDAAARRASVSELAGALRERVAARRPPAAGDLAAERGFLTGLWAEEQRAERRR